jgi:hypothetical protein
MALVHNQPTPSLQSRAGVAGTEGGSGGVYIFRFPPSVSALSSCKNKSVDYTSYLMYTYTSSMMCRKEAYDGQDEESCV